MSHSGVLAVSVLFSEPKIPQTPARRAASCGAARFQCSSASRKFLKLFATSLAFASGSQFQCSSASRKFLKTLCARRHTLRFLGFSALQRAENSSK